MKHNSRFFIDIRYAVYHDARVIHETTPIQPNGAAGHRDTLVLTWRHDGFLDPP